jgi:iron complex transport system substrate-binding protein
MSLAHGPAASSTAQTQSREQSRERSREQSHEAPPSLPPATTAPARAVKAIPAAPSASSPAAGTRESAALSVIDDSGRIVRLPRAARRIVSLAPHATELLFAAGAGKSLVGVTDYSDFPPAAAALPSMGSATAFDVERIAALRPDLVVAWGSGNPASRLDALRALGIAVFESEPREFDAIATSLERLGKLAGTRDIADAAATRFRQRLAALETNYRQRAPVGVFYQVWSAPLMTLNDRHLVSKTIALCGGVNVFGRLAPLAPTVSLESVLRENPEVILRGGGGTDGHVDSLDAWRRFPGLTAVSRNNLFAIDADTLVRSGPRMADGVLAVCEKLELARRRRK